MPSPLGEGQTDKPINRLHLGEVPSSHPNFAFHSSVFTIPFCYPSQRQTTVSYIQTNLNSRTLGY